MHTQNHQCKTTAIYPRCKIELIECTGDLLYLQQVLCGYYVFCVFMKASIETNKKMFELSYESISKPKP